MVVYFIRFLHDKQHVFSLTLEEFFFEKNPLVSLVFHLHLWWKEEEIKRIKNEKEYMKVDDEISKSFETIIHLKT